MRGRIKTGVAAGAMILALGGSATAGPAQPMVRNAEDMILLPGGRWVVASSMAEGGLETGLLSAVDVRTGKVNRIFPNGAAPAARSARCSGPPSEFKSHGIDYLPGPGGGELFVVNHGERQSIEVFSVKTGASGPRLQWVDCLPLPPNSVGNAVSATPAGIFATATFAANLSASTGARGAALRWRDNGWQEVPDSSVDAPAGILASPDGHEVYVTSWSGLKVVDLTLSVSGTSRREIATSFHPDNLRWARNGAVLVAGQGGSSDEILGCAKSPDAECKSPPAGGFGVIDPKGFRLVCTAPTPNPVATVAIDVGEERWFGSFRSLRIASTPLNAACR